MRIADTKIPVKEIFMANTTRQLADLVSIGPAILDFLKLFENLKK